MLNAARGARLPPLAVAILPRGAGAVAFGLDTRGVPSTRCRCAAHGAYVTAEHFASAAFGVSPAEAAWMDPHQRLLLEVGYQALHAAGGRRRALLGRYCVMPRRLMRDA